MSENKRTALITGGSAGFGRALARALAARDWNLIVTARGAERLERVRAETGATAIQGDVTDPGHIWKIAEALRATGRLDLVVNNASRLGPSPMPRLAEFPIDELATVYQTNVLAPLAILQTTLPYLRASHGVAVDVSSDAAVNAYEGWGGYGSSKAALDHLTAIIAAENTDVPIYSFDPGDMRTDMHQAAFPGEDISDRPEPESVVPALLRLLETRPASGRFVAAQLLVSA